MRRILHLALAGLVVLLPIEVHAASSTSTAHKKKKPKQTRAAEVEQEREAERSQAEAEEESQGARRRRKRQPKTIDVAPAEEGGEAKKDAPATEPGKAPAPAPAEEEDDTDFEDNPSKWVEALTQKVPPRRYGYVLGVLIGGTGLVFAYQAQGEAKRAETITSAHEAQRAVANARASAALANVLYGLAGAAILLALVLEFVPEPLAERANLTFHF